MSKSKMDDGFDEIIEALKKSLLEEDKESQVHTLKNISLMDFLKAMSGSDKKMKIKDFKRQFKSIKNGDAVTCVIDGEKINDAKVCITEDGNWFIANNKVSGCAAPAQFGYFRMFALNSDKDLDYIKNFKLAKKELNNLAIGDWVINEDGYIQEVMAINYSNPSNLIYFLSVGVPEKKFHKDHIDFNYTETFQSAADLAGLGYDVYIP